MEFFAYAIKLLIAGLFIHAGFSKLQPQNQSYYADVIDGYGVIPVSFSHAMPKLIGASEFVISMAVLSVSFAHFGLLAAALLLAVYLASFAKQLVQGQTDINCGCAGPGMDVKISPMLLLRNVILIGLCLTSVSVGASSLSTTWLLAIPLAATMGLIYLSCEQLIINQQKIVRLQNV